MNDKTQIFEQLSKVNDASLIEKYLELNEIECSGNSSDDKVISQLTKLYKLLIQCNQFEEFDKDQDYRVCYRVVKIRRFIDRFRILSEIKEVQKNGGPEFAFGQAYISGMWMALPGIHVSKSGLKKMTRVVGSKFKYVDYKLLNFPDELLDKIIKMPVTIAPDGTAFIPFSNLVTNVFYSGNNFKLFVTETI